jgi:hypothetical protein
VPFDPRRDGNDARNAGRLRARNHGIELAGEIGKVEMAVAVDQRRLRSPTFVIIRYRHAKSFFYR